ncbi:regulator of MON1-CCZ1 complex [Aricia agestis]|uniref:regulator of MON1-CCZ1 complex n=1 Tax=Aricia agestis TaxID=91739 RepID=UPI001C205FE1|nr:regulator of MON1-CCZ1 complex [Aricia agestis]
MTVFSLIDSDKYYLSLSEHPKRFDADSPVTNVFFDDTNGQVFTVRSGGVTGVTVNGMDESKCTSFRMEDKGPIISIKFSPDHKILAIQRNIEGQNATVEFVNFKDLAPTNIEYTHTCKWKTSRILGFVWPKVDEIAFITDHGIELLQVVPEKKQLKTLKSTSFSCAWYSWCAQSNIVVLAGNNGLLLQPFSLNNSTITKLQKLELESSKPAAERDVFVVRLCGASWCAVFRHAHGPADVWLMPIGSSGIQHVLKTGLTGRFAVSVLDNLLAIHHQSSQTSQLFDILEESRLDNNTVVHVPLVSGVSIRPASVDDAPCAMYSGNWVVFQPDYIIDARRGCLWRVQLQLNGLAHSIPKDAIPSTIAALLRRQNGKDTIFRILNQLMTEARTYLVELTKAFDEINAVYRRWSELEVARNTAGSGWTEGAALPVVISQEEICSHLLTPHFEDPYLVQVVTAYLSSLCRSGIPAAACTSGAGVRALVSHGAGGRLRALVRRAALPDSRPLACQLLSLQRTDRAAAQLALDMMARLHAHAETTEVLVSSGRAIAGLGAARAAGGALWARLSARKHLAAAPDPASFVATYHAFRARNEALQGTSNFDKTYHCKTYEEYYKQLMSEN